MGRAGIGSPRQMGLCHRLAVALLVCALAVQQFEEPPRADEEFSLSWSAALQEETLQLRAMIAKNDAEWHALSKTKTTIFAQMNAHAEDIQRQEVDQSDHLAEQMMRDLKRHSDLRAQVVAVEA